MCIRRLNKCGQEDNFGKEGRISVDKKIESVWKRRFNKCGLEGCIGVEKKFVYLWIRILCLWG